MLDAWAESQPASGRPTSFKVFLPTDPAFLAVNTGVHPRFPTHAEVDRDGILVPGHRLAGFPVFDAEYLHPATAIWAEGKSIP